MGERIRWLGRWHNIRIAPIVLLVRLPIMLVGITMHNVGEWICMVGDKLPAFTEFDPHAN